MILGARKVENKPSEPKNEIWAPKSNIFIDPEFYKDEEFYTDKEKSPKTKFGLQNQYGRIFRSDIL
jgi:hypothetical protein